MTQQSTQNNFESDEDFRRLSRNLKRKEDPRQFDGFSLISLALSERLRSAPVPLTLASVRGVEGERMPYHRPYAIPHRIPELPYKIEAGIHQHHGRDHTSAAEKRHPGRDDSGLSHAHHGCHLCKRRRGWADSRYR